jgi:hypothetical protein
MSRAAASTSGTFASMSAAALAGLACWWSGAIWGLLTIDTAR